MGHPARRLILIPLLPLVLLHEPTRGQNNSVAGPSADQSLQQPGDDILRDALPVRRIDEKTTKSLAWYMSGIAAQKNNDLAGAIEAFSQSALADPEAAEPVRAQALLLIRAGRLSEGMTLARQAIALDPGDFRTRFQLASVLLRQPSEPTIREAIDLIEAALESDRLDSTNEEFILIHSVRGRLLLQLGQQAEALKSYQVLLQALERPEDFGLDYRRHRAMMQDQLTGYESVGAALLTLGQTEDAIRAFEALVRIDQDNPGRHHLLLANALYEAKRLEEAEKSLNDFLSTGQRDEESLKLLSNIFAASSRSSLIIPRLTELLQDANDASVVQLFLANTQLQQGQIQEAVESYNKVILDSGNPAAHLGLMRVDILTANADSLIRTLQKALRARISIDELQPLRAQIVEDPEFAKKVLSACIAALEDDAATLFPETTFLCAQIAETIQDDDAQVRLLNATLNLNPNQKIGIESLDLLAMHYLLKENYSESAQLYRRLQSIPGIDHGRRVVTLLRLSIAESMSDQHEQAVEAIRTAIDLQPNHPELTYRLGWIQYRADLLAEAEKSLAHAISLNGDDAAGSSEARMLLAVVFSRTQRFDDSIREYTAVIENSSEDPDMRRRARMALSAVHVELQDNAEAERILEGLYEEDPNDPGVNNDLGYLYADQNKNLEKALTMIQLAVASSPDNQAYLDSLGWVLHRLERHEEALEALIKANSDPDFQDATLQEHLADVYFALGRRDDAVAAWTKALATEQSSEHPDENVVERLKSHLEATGSSDSSAEKPQQVAPVGTPGE